MNMKIAQRLWITLLITLLTCSATVTRAADLATVLTEVKAAAGQTDTLYSHFTQEKHLDIMAETLLSQGLFAYRKPDHLRWELLTPIVSGFVLRGQQGERWNGLSRELERFSVERDPLMGMIAQQLLAWARVDLDWLQQRYVMELVSEQPLQLKLTPRDAGEAGFIDHLEIFFAADRRYVEQVVLVEKSGDSTRLRFTDVKVNGSLPDDIFAAPVF